MRWMNQTGITVVVGLCALGFVRAGVSQNANRSSANWPTIGGTEGNSHDSPLRQINRSNVAKLQEAWRFDTGESGGLETTPVVVGGVLYAFTPHQQVIALRGDTGKLVWRFDPAIKGTMPERGLTYWTNGKEARLFAGILNFVYALDPATGNAISSFGTNGRIDLRENLGREPKLQSVALTSPGVIYKDLLIVGGRNPETLPAPPGDIRAYDVHSGALRWSFHTIPRPGEFGFETWPKDAWKTSGAANNWAGMAVDSERGIVYVPTGSAAPDFYGRTRIGDDLFADTLLALDAATGRRIWHFQGVHHDLWDRDFPAPPILVSLRRNGKAIPAVAQTTKQGYLYVFDRVSGAPLFPIQEKPCPASTAPREVAAATQPFPLAPEPFVRQAVTEDTLTSRTPEAHEWAVQRLREIRHDGQFVPLSVGKDTLVYPSFEGGGEWGGPAEDPDTGVLYINANNYASIGALAANDGGSAGRTTYMNRCSICHGAKREGSNEFPALTNIAQKLTTEQIAATIHDGKGRMPATPLEDKALKDLLDYLATDETAETTTNPEGGNEYVMTGYRRFLDPDGYPATAPPWGTLSALDLKTGKYLWQIPLGEYPELTAKGVPVTGTENYGGPVVTAGGLIFIAATNFDDKIRALDKTTGKLLWQAALPFAGNATPALYEMDGREYVVIAAGGGSLNLRGPAGGVYVAYALPQ